MLDFVAIVKEVLVAERRKTEPLLNLDDINELLCEDDVEDNARTSIFGYPTRPLYREIGNMLNIWMETNHCPIHDLPSYELLDEKSVEEKRASDLSKLSDRLKAMKTLHGLWSKDEICFNVRDILKILAKRGLMDLIGIRNTIGTLEQWPPSRKVLTDTFQAKHSDKAELSVGARALSKHSHRDSTEVFWGICLGSERDKNQHALGIMNTILDSATWINIHQIVHGVQILEIRQEKGYGLRWTADGLMFRGFLEPQMKDGHESGWRH